MKILIACEESQAVTIEFRKLGLEAWSCDLQPCTGSHPEWHLQGDLMKYLYPTSYDNWIKWDMIIAFPPCTHLAVSGARWFKEKRESGVQQDAIDFFMKIANADCKRIAIENPVGIMSTVWRKPDQVIQPYWFGDPYKKSTCLWLKELPKLKPTQVVEPELIKYECKNGKTVTFSKDYGHQYGEKGRIRRAKTYPGIAKAMAEQWSEYL